MTRHLSSAFPSLQSALPAVPLALLLASAAPAAAQEAVTPSVTGLRIYDNNAEIRKNAAPEGPKLNVSLGASVNAEYNDNINFSDKNAKPDFVITPNLRADITWRATRYNSLKFSLGLGYTKYLDHSEFDSTSIIVAPDSAFVFNLYVGDDLLLRFYDRFSIQQDQFDDIVLSDVVGFTRFTNAAGVTAIWNLNDVIVQGGYQRQDLVSFDDEFSYLDKSIDSVSLSATFKLNDAVSLGVESSVAQVDYKDPVLNGATTYLAGIFGEFQPSNYIKFRIALGYQTQDFDSNGTVGDFSGKGENPYGNLSLTHRVNSHLTYRLSAGYESRLGVNSNAVDIFYIRHEADWKFINNLQLSTSIFHETVEETGGAITEKYDRTGGGVSLSYPVAKNTTLALAYQFAVKNSDVIGRDYTQNRFTLNLSYRF